MRKIVAFLFAFIMMFSMGVFADNGISVILDGETLEFLEQPPVIIESRTLVPLRKIFESLGAEVTWDNDTKTAISKKDDITVKIQIDNKNIDINGKIEEIDVPAQLINNKTLVPIRAVSEAFGCDVNWDGENRIVNIKSDAYSLRESLFKTYTSEKYGYTISYSDEYTLYDSETTGVETCDFLLYDNESGASLNVVVTQNSLDASSVKDEDLRKSLESAFGVVFDNYRILTLNGIQTISYEFKKSDTTIMQNIYFTDEYLYTVTLGLTDNTNENTIANLMFSLHSLKK